jgi:hypothetical protein
MHVEAAAYCTSGAAAKASKVPHILGSSDLGVNTSKGPRFLDS